MNTLHPIEKGPHATSKFMDLKILSFFRLYVVINGIEIELDAIKTGSTSATPYPGRPDLPLTFHVHRQEPVLHRQGPVSLSIDSGV